MRAFQGAAFGIGLLGCTFGQALAQESCTIQPIPPGGGPEATAALNANFACLNSKLDQISAASGSNKQPSGKASEAGQALSASLESAQLSEDKKHVTAEVSLTNVGDEPVFVSLLIGKNSGIRVRGYSRGMFQKFSGISECKKGSIDQCLKEENTDMSLLDPGQGLVISLASSTQNDKLDGDRANVFVGLIVRIGDKTSRKDFTFPDTVLSSSDG